MSDSLFPRSLWHGLDGVTYLYTGAHAPSLTAAARATELACLQQSDGPAGRQALYDIETRARTAVSRLAGVAPEDVGFLGDASTGWNSVAHGMVFESGDNVVLNELEHPSVLYPFLRLRPAGLEVRVVPRDANWRVTPAAVAEACDGRTRAIAVSHVAYVNGFRHDLGALREVADRHNAALFIDYSHSFGVVPVDMGVADIGICASYKWLLGTYGVGITVWNRHRCPEFVPGIVGWRSTDNIFTADRFTRIPLSADASRFQLGAPAFGSIAALEAGVDQLLTVDRGRVATHALDLTARCITALVGRGLQVITAVEPEQRAGNVAFLHPDSDRIVSALAERKVYAWGGDGRVRASFHVMCGAGDVDTFVGALDEILPGLAGGGVA